MSELPLLAAAGLGLVMTVSPCPLATNIAAVAYLGRHGANPRAVAAGGAAYALGRALAYTVLATVLAKGLFAMPAVSWFLQNRLQGLIGPLLIFTGLILLGWISLPAFRGGLNARRMKRLGAAGLLDGLRATTHHRAMDELAETAPACSIVRGVRYVDSGKIITSAGIATGIDAALHIVSRLISPDTALETARHLEYRWQPE